MSNFLKLSGNLSRLNGLNFETKVFNLLVNNTDLTKKIIYQYNNCFNNISNISVILVQKLNNHDIIEINKFYSHFRKPTNLSLELPINKKRACDIIILYVENNNLHTIGIDTKKSQGKMTQLVRKSYNLLKEYLTCEEYNILFSYLQYQEKNRIWNNLNQDLIYKNYISSIVEKIKKIWIQERFDNNSLYHNHLIMTLLDNTFYFIDVNKLLKYMSYPYCYKKQSNFIFNNNNYDLVCIKPHGSSCWTDIQISLYKSAYQDHDISFSIQNNE